MAQVRVLVVRSAAAVGAAVVLSVGLGGCGGGGDAAAEVAAKAGLAAAGVPRSFAPLRAPLRAASANLVSNSDFESGLAGWVDWGNAQVVDGSGTVGSRALRVGSDAGGAGHDAGSVVPGTRYRLSAQAKVSEPSEIVYLGINILDESAAVVAQQVVPVSDTAYWLASVEIVAPDAAVRALVFAWKNGGSGYGYVDEVVLAPADASAAPPAGAAANLLSNADFSAGMTGWMNWSNAQVVDASAVSGPSRALRVGTAAGGAGHDVAGIVAGTTYRLSAQAKVSDASETMYLGVNVLDPSGSVVAQRIVPVGGTGYALATLEITAPANAAQAVVFVWKNAGSGYGYLDDAVLAALDGATPPPPRPPPPPPATGNMVANGGLESGLAGWTNWGNAAAVTGESSSGSSSVAVGSDAGGVGQEIAGIAAGQAYSLSGQVKVSAGSELGYLGVRYMDAAGANLLERSVAFSSTVYSTAQLDLVAPANAASALVYVWKNVGGGFAHVDDIALVPVGGGAAGPKAVFIGNSITYSIATPSMGWNHTSGMAASSTQTDYAHLVAASLQVAAPSIANFSALERDPAANKWLIPEFTSAIDDATAVTIELGDNAQLARLAEFADAYDALLAAAGRARTLVCVSTWWEESTKDAMIRSACEAHGGRYVHIGDVLSDPVNLDRLEGPQYADASVQDHPHDWSMARIAQRIVAAHAR